MLPKKEHLFPKQDILTRDFSPGISDAMDILTLGLLGLGLGRVLGLELGRQDVPGLKNTGVNFLASGRSRQDVADPSFLEPKFVFSMSLHLGMWNQSSFL